MTRKRQPTPTIEYNRTKARLSWRVWVPASAVVLVIAFMILFPILTAGMVIAFSIPALFAGVVGVAYLARTLYVNSRKNEWLDLGPNGALNVITGQHITKATAPRIEAGHVPMLQAPALPTIEQALTDTRCQLVYGAAGSGKTTVLKQIMSRQSGVIVLDPKGNEWGPATVEQNEQRYQAIVEQVLAELTARRKGASTSREQITLVVDELYTIQSVFGIDISKAVFAIVALGREYNIHASLTASGKGVKDLNIQGQSGLLENLALVHLSKHGNQFGAEIDIGQGFFPVAHPFTYTTAPQPSTKAQQIAAYLSANPNATNYAVCKALFGGNRNSSIYGEIDAVRRYNAVITE